MLIDLCILENMNTVVIPMKDPVSVDSRILGGTPVVKGTRIPVSLVLDLLEKGYSFDLITKEYPSLSESKLSKLLRLFSKSFNAQKKAI